MPMLQAVNAAALMERTPFAIDDAMDDDDDDDESEETGDHDQVMDEVYFNAFSFQTDADIGVSGRCLLGRT